MIIPIILFFIILLFFLRKRQKVKYHLPEGPRGLPIFGNLFQIGAQPHLQFSKWTKSYGNLFTVYLAHKPALIVNDAQLIKELFGKAATAGRFQTNLLNELSWSGSFGLAAAVKETFSEQKRFLSLALKESGVSQPIYLEPLILAEIESLLNHLQTEQSRNGKVFFNKTLKLSTSDFLWSMFTGEKATGNTPAFHLFYKVMAQILTVTKSGLLFFPWLKYIAPVKTGYTDFVELAQKIRKCVEKTFESHIQRKRNPNEGASRDLVDFYVDKLESCTNLNSSFFGQDGRKHSLATIANLMVAGIDSTGAAIQWILFCLTGKPEVQEKLWKEIKEVIGKDEDPCFADKPKMPYMEAVILETLRYSLMSPIGVPHVLLEDITFKGYLLPKGMVLIANLHHVHNDPSIWKDPENFRPERFIEDGGANIKDFVMAFPSGKRACPGEQIAKDLMFMFVTKLVQKYKFSGDMENVKNGKEYLEPVEGMVLYPKNIAVVVSQRI